METIKLIREQPLNDWVESLVYPNGKTVFGVAELKNHKWCAENRKTIKDALIFKYLKLHLRSYLMQFAGQNFLVPVQPAEDMPEWAMDAANPAYEFIAENVPFSFRDNIAKTKIMLDKAADQYIAESLNSGTVMSLGALSQNPNLGGIEKIVNFCLVSRIGFSSIGRS